MKNPNKKRNLFNRLRNKFFNRFSSVIVLGRYRIIELAFLFTKGERIEGDYYEFGIGSGKSMYYAYDNAKRLKQLSNISFIGFDSFVGFPEIESIDKKSNRIKKGEANIPIESFYKYMKDSKVDLSKLKIFKGFFSETLKPNIRGNMKKARIVNIDCDLYVSTEQALNFITPLLQCGTVILFDDYYIFKADPELGEQKAISEWLNKNLNISLIEYNNYATFGKSFIVNMEKMNDDNLSV